MTSAAWNGTFIEQIQYWLPCRQALKSLPRKITRDLSALAIVGVHKNWSSYKNDQFAADKNQGYDSNVFYPDFPLNHNTHLITHFLGYLWNEFYMYLWGCGHPVKYVINFISQQKDWLQFFFSFPYWNVANYCNTEDWDSLIKNRQQFYWLLRGDLYYRFGGNSEIVGESLLPIRRPNISQTNTSVLSMEPSELQNAKKVST